jgi:hypothetical protein
MFHAEFAFLAASNPQARHEYSRTHNGLSVETPQDAHSLVVPPRVDGDEVCSFAFAFVFEQREERPPRRRSVAAVRRTSKHSLDVQVFDGNEVVLAGVVRRKLVQEVTAFFASGQRDTSLPDAVVSRNYSIRAACVRGTAVRVPVAHARLRGRATRQPFRRCREYT